MNKVSEVLIVGGGVAGFLAAINLKAKLPALRVQVLCHPLHDDFSPEVIATTPAFPKHIHSELNVPPLAFLQAVRPTWTLGTRYHWGPRDFFDYTYEFQLDTKYQSLSRETGFYVGDAARAFEAVGPASALMSRGRIFYRGKDGGPQIPPDRFGYHFHHQTLLDLLKAQAAQLGAILRDGRMIEALRSEDRVAGIRLQTGEVLTADLFVDATGSQSLLLGRALGTAFENFAPSLACDRAIVASWQRSNEPIQPHTSVQATAAGWSWRTDHQQLITCGHAFSSAHLDAGQAELALREIYPDCGPSRLLKFTQGRYQKAWVQNVVGIGNAAAFVEPLAAAGPGVLAFACQWLAQTLVDCDGIVRPTLIKQFNKRWQRLVEGEREFLGLFYRYNNRPEPFWRASREHSHLGDLQIVVNCYQDLGPDSIHRFTLLHESDPIGLEGYFSVLVGQNVPWRRTWTPPADQLATWQTIVNNWHRKAADALTVEQATAALTGTGPTFRVGPPRRAMETVV